MKKVAFRIVCLCICALLLPLGISACGSNEAANSFNTLAGDIGQLQNQLSSKISEAETTLSGTKVEDLADPAVLDQLRNEIAAAKSLSIDIPDIASDKSVIAQQVEDLTTLQDKLQEQYDSLNSAVSAIAASKQQLAKNIAAEKEAKIQESITPKNFYSTTMTDASGYKEKVTINLGSWIKGSETELVNKAWAQVGGKGSMPLYATNIDLPNSGSNFTPSDAAFVFGTITVENMTPEYSAELFNGGNFGVQADFRYEPDGDWGLNLLDSKVGPVMFAVQYSSSTDIDQLYGGFLLRAKLTSNKWGPVPVVFGADNVFTPDYPDGNPAMDGAYFNLFSGDAYGIKNPPIGKTW